MILGPRCTRKCKFCAVEKGPPASVDPMEPQRLAEAVRRLDLKYVVVTSVTRDDLTDGGADQFVRTMKRIRALCPQTGVEILVPDFQGSGEALGRVCRAQPDVFNHNIETVPRLYKKIRPQAEYSRSLMVLEAAARSGLPVKSGLMLGLGEEKWEIASVLRDLREVGCSYLTIGQYLSPSSSHAPVVCYVSPRQFKFEAL